MVSVLDLQHRAEPAAEPVAASAPEPSQPPQEFEFVLGRRQVASLLFVFSIVLMICVAASYVAGKAMSPKAQSVMAASPEPAVSQAGSQAVSREPEPPPIVLNQEPAPEPPLFAEPKAGSVYIQMGAVEKGVSIIFAEGLRKHGLASFVAPGPSEKIFRVLIGPLADPAAYNKAKDTVDQIGLATFARKFPN
jgi:cell division septation protein DedD